MWAGHVIDGFIDVYSLSSQLVSILSSKLDLIIEAKSRFNALPILQVMLRFSTDKEFSIPFVGFDVETTQFLGAVGAKVNIDIYEPR